MVFVLKRIGIVKSFESSEEVVEPVTARQTTPEFLPSVPGNNLRSCTRLCVTAAPIADKRRRDYKKMTTLVFIMSHLVCFGPGQSSLVREGV